MNIKRIKHINELIKKQRTGNPAVLASKIGISERATYKYLKYMKEELEAPIQFHAVRQSYSYSEHGELDLKWKKH